MRALILLTAFGEIARGDVLYGVFCIVALALTLFPAIVAHPTHARTFAVLEVGILLLMVCDMTLGNLLGLYVRLPWYDKVLHLGSATLIGLVGFLSIYALRATARARFPGWLEAVAILLVTLGIGALWEIAEYLVDRIIGRATQSAPGMTPLDDTMIDLIVDGLGGVVAAVLGSCYPSRVTGAIGRAPP